MKRLFDETFASSDQKMVSRNIWYGYIELYKDGEYGKQIVLNEDLLNVITDIVKGDILEKKELLPTEVNWYLYGNTKTKDAIEDEIRPNIMIRYKESKFTVRCNISDHDFALNIDTIIDFEQKTQKLLERK